MATTITEIPGYSAPPASTTTPSPASSFTLSVAAVPTPNMAAFCTISKKCQIEAAADGKPPRPLPCDPGDFECMCSKTNAMGHNEYFSAHCIFTECNNADARRAFMSKYIEGCTNITTGLTDIPAEWLPFVPSPQPITTAPASSTDEVITKTNLPPQILTSTIASFQSSTMALIPSPPDTAAPTTTSLADPQIPICGVSQKCKKQYNHSVSCRADDFQCICKASNSLANNTQFDQQCVFDECHDDVGLREFLDTLIYNCKEVGRELIDIPDRWKVYLPGSTTSSSSSLTVPTTTITSTSTGIPASETPQTQRTHLADGAIAGIAIGVVLILGVLFAMGIAHWRARKKAKELTRENAILADRTSAHGASARIDKVMADHSATSLTMTDGGTTLVSTSRRETQGYKIPGRDINRLESHGRQGRQAHYGKEGYGREMHGQPF